MRRTAVLLLAVALVATACEWTMGRYDTGRTGVNPASQAFDVSTVDQLEAAWYAPIGSAANESGWPIATPLLTRGRAYVTDGDGIAVFDAAGTDGCSGEPVPTCTPLWRYQSSGLVSLEPTIADGLLYAPVYVSVVETRIEVFDVDGAEGCSGSPVVCQPLWTIDLDGGGTNGVTVAEGLVLASVYDVGLIAADAAGVRGCSNDAPPVCQPLWRGGHGVEWPGPPAVHDGRAYTTTYSWTPEAGTSSRVVGYDLTPTGCSADPIPLCEPTWRSHEAWVWAPPAVRGGQLFVTDSWEMRSYDLADATTCDADGCPPRWTAPSHGGASPVVYQDVVLAPGTPLAAYPTTACAAPDPCAPIWVTEGGAGGFRSAPTVAGGVLFAGSAAKLRAFDAGGMAGCTGSDPATCSALWEVTPSDVTPHVGDALPVGPPAVAGGTVVVALGDVEAPQRYVVAYRMP